MYIYIYIRFVCQFLICLTVIISTAFGDIDLGNGICWNNIAYSGDAPYSVAARNVGVISIKDEKFSSKKGRKPVNSLNIVTPKDHQSTALEYPTLSLLHWVSIITISGAIYLYNL